MKCILKTSWNLTLKLRKCSKFNEVEIRINLEGHSTFETLKRPAQDLFIEMSFSFMTAFSL